jgi:hypothetical protein
LRRKKTFYITENCGQAQKPKQKKQSWKAHERREVLEFFKKNIKEKQLPKKKECMDFLQLPEEISGRKWSHIKDFVRNYIKQGKSK